MFSKYLGEICCWVPLLLPQATKSAGYSLSNCWWTLQLMSRLIGLSPSLCTIQEHGPHIWPKFLNLVRALDESAPQNPASSGFPMSAWISSSVSYLTLSATSIRLPAIIPPSRCLAPNASALPLWNWSSEQLSYSSPLSPCLVPRVLGWSDNGARSRNSDH